MELVALVAVVALLVGPSSATPSSFTLQGALGRIVFPSSQKGVSFPLALADFGRPDYGATVVGRLVYPSEDPAYSNDGKTRRCSGSVACQYACQDLTAATPPFQFDKKPGELLIMLLDRGPRDYDQPCYFITKVYHAQLAGADAVIVADDIGGEDLTTPIVPEEEKAAHLLDELTVSASLITKKDGDILKSLLKDQGQVVLALDWTKVEHKKQQVSWEFWTTTNDQCGTLCKEQTAFLNAMKPYARALEQANQTVFNPHYMLWSCPPIYKQTEECLSECIMEGTYCNPDPDGKYSAGYSGKDVLAMNVRSLCFARLARQAGQSWLWWDYAEQFAANCTSTSNSYNADCADKVFKAVQGPILMNNNGSEVWAECIAGGSAPPAGSTVTKLPLLEEELNIQQGTADVAAVSILPTVRVEGVQYRGTLNAAGVMRAICSAFPTDKEPDVCNEKWVSQNECEVGSIGYKNCRVGDPLTGGSTRCINTFSGYRCECGQGWTATVKEINGINQPMCEDVNECLTTNVRLTDPQCSCERCACVNTPGSYKCTGELSDRCTPQYDYGGCWHSTVDGQTFHACEDGILAYRRKATNGSLTDSDKWYSCKCPGCFAASGGTDSNPVCSKMCDLSQCKQGLCVDGPFQPPGAGPVPAPAPAPRGGGGGSGGGGGMSVGTILVAVLISVAATVGGLYAVYHYVLRQRMEGEIRDIMSQYMPLGGDNNRRGGGSSGRGARGGFSSLAPVEEEGDGGWSEDAPLMSNGSGGGNRGTSTGAPAAGAGMQLQAVNNGGSYRTAFGSLAGTQHAGFPSSRSAGYQPPLPVPEDDAVMSGLLSASQADATGVAVAKEVGSKSQGGAGKPHVGDAPLLGEGPL